MNASTRKKLLWVHTWSGLTVGLVVVFLALTGAGLVLKDALEDVVYGKLHEVALCNYPLPLDRLAEAAVRAHPASKLHSIEVKSDDRASVAVMFADKDYVYVDPCSATVLGVQNQYGGFFGTMDWLHRFRFFSDLKLGRTVAGWANAVFLVLLIGLGFALWWPRNRRALKAGLKFNPRLPGSARTLSLHKIVGVYTAVILLVLTITGLPLGFEPVKEAIYSATGYVPPKKPRSLGAPDGAKQVSMEEFWQKTRSLVPDLEWVSLRYPANAGAAFEAEIVQKNSPHSIAKGYHYMDAFSGKTLKLSNYQDDQHIGRKIYLYCIALHAGMVGGLPYQLLLFVCALGVVVQAYSGFSPYLRRKLRRPAPQGLVVRLAAKKVEAEGICSFELTHPEGEPLPRFSPGSHVDVHIGNGIVRQYSLCSDPNESHRYLICVQREAKSRGGSSAMHERLQVGDLVRISEPKNHFALEPSAQRSILIAGGIGITPLLSMAHSLANAGAAFELHYCVRSQERAAFLEALKGSKFFQRVKFHFSDGPAEQRMDIHKILCAPHLGTHIYTCGPQGFMTMVARVAKEKGWSDRQVHQEHFVGATYADEANAPFTVKIASTGAVIPVAKEQSVAQALQDHGVEIPTSCAEGVCGTCLTRVLGGEVEHRDRFLTAEERKKNNQFTPCCSRARCATLVLDL